MSDFWETHEDDYNDYVEYMEGFEDFCWIEDSPYK